MSSSSPLSRWTLAAPLAGWLLVALARLEPGAWFHLLAAAGLLGAVLSAVHHAEVVAHRVGEPFGTLVLAGAVTVIEVALIVSLMLAGGESTRALARDTVFASVMIILDGIVGACMLFGALRHGEQDHSLRGTSAALATLAAIVTLTLVLPNATTSVPGPSYSASQLGFVAVVALMLYGSFVFVQTVRHRDYFLPPGAAAAEEHEHAARPAARVALASLGLLLVALGAVVLLAKSISPALEAAVEGAGAPKALVGVLIAGIVLLPEGLAALRAARANRLQTSLNLALGSALATIGLTIPAVALVSIANGWTLTLGIDAKASVLLVLSLFVAALSLGTGRTTVLQGAIQLLIFAVYLFTTIVP